MELGIYAIKRNMDYFKVDEEYSFMDFLQTGIKDDVIKNTLYSLATYGLPMDAVELYLVGFFYTTDGYIRRLYSNSAEIDEDSSIDPYTVSHYECIYEPVGTSVKVKVDLMPYEKTYEYFVSEIKRLRELSESKISDDHNEEVKIYEQKKRVPDDV